jgi:hypothetical protein
MWQDYTALYMPLIAVLVSLMVMTASGQARVQGGPQRGGPTDAEVRQAITAIEQADTYRQIVDAATRYEAVLGSARVVELLEELLQNPALDTNQRGLVVLERQLSLDTRQRGATAAARLLSIRLIAGYALLADSPQQFAAVLEKFSGLAKEVNPKLVREALDTPGNTWPAGLFPLMEQLAQDWPQQGALGAASRMVKASEPAPAKPPPAQPAKPTRGLTLVGHWRSTTLVFESPRDEHLVLRADGTADTWIVTASSKTPTTRGRWRSQGATLSVDWADGRQWSQPFTFFEGKLVFPNIANRREFWEPIE